MYFLLKHEQPSINSSDKKEKIGIVSAHKSMEEAQQALYEFALHFYGFDDEHDLEYHARDTIYGTLSDDHMEFMSYMCEDDDLIESAPDNSTYVAIVEFSL